MSNMSNLSNLTNRQTVAYSPGPARANPETDAATLFASPAQTITSPGPESVQPTMFATADSSPLGGQAPAAGKLTLGRSAVTVLPEMRSEGERLIMVPT